MVRSKAFLSSLGKSTSHSREHTFLFTEGNKAIFPATVWVPLSQSRALSDGIQQVESFLSLVSVRIHLVNLWLIGSGYSWVSAVTDLLRVPQSVVEPLVALISSP